MPTQNSDFRAVLIVLLLLWIFLSPDSSDPASLTPPEIAQARQARFQGALDVLNMTRWGDFAPNAPGKGDDSHKEDPRFQNVTGFSQLDGKGYAWEDLGRFRNRCREWSRNAFPSSTNLGRLVDENDWERSINGPAVWQNVTGTLHGTWVRRPGTVSRQAAGYNLSAIAPGATWPSGLGEWGRNITGDHGTIELRIDEDEGGGVYEEKAEGEISRGAGLAREIQVVATIQDEATKASSLSLHLHGVHWPRQGAILLTTSSEKFDGIFGLPHLAPGPGYFHTGQYLLNETLGKIIQAREKSKYGFPSNPWGSRMDIEDDGIAAQCEYVMYVQLHPMYLSRWYKDPDELESFIEEVERELRFPTGAPVGRIPDLRASMVTWSPDCSFFLESKGPPHFPVVDGDHLVGMKEDMFTYTAKEWLIAFAAVILGQIWLFKAQMKQSSTPSTTGRVSFWTVGTMLFADGMIFVTACAWSLNATITLLPCLLVTFAAFISMFIEGAFLSEVWKIQEPERRIREREREQAAAANRSASSSGAAAASTAPQRATTQPQAPAATTQSAPPAAPVPPAQPRQPIIVPSDGDIDEAEQLADLLSGASALPLPATATRPGQQSNQPNEPRPPTTFSTVAKRFVLAGLFLLFLSAVATSWPSHIRSFYVNTLSFLYLSLWLPQIIRNTQRNSRQAYSWRFMIGQSVLRLLPFAYFFLREDNVLLADPDPYAFLVFVGWMWIQLWIMFAQSILGPRFGVPRGWVREAWDYHPVLRDDDLEGVSLPIGLARTGTGLSTASVSPTEERNRSWSVGGGGPAPASTEGGEPSSATAAGSSGGGGPRHREREKEREKQKGVTMCSVDCAICRELLEVPVFKAGGSGSSSGSASVGGGGGPTSGITGVFARKAYMVTPCRHIFHTDCLEGWMKYRLQCPICREELPPL